MSACVCLDRGQTLLFLFGSLGCGLATLLFGCPALASCSSQMTMSCSTYCARP